MISRSLTLYEAARHFGWPGLEDTRICELLITYACNAKCLFCYNPAALRAGTGGMTAQRAARILYEGHRGQGCRAAFFTGGDPTVHPRLAQFIALARKIGYGCVSLDSNGLRLADPDYAQELVSAGANEFGLSLHGSTAEIHDRLVGVEGAWRRCCRALENLKKFKVHIKINFAVTRLNYQDLPRLVELLMRRYGESHLCVMFTHFKGVLWDNRESLGVSYAEIVQPTLETLALYEKNGIGIENRMLIQYLPCVLPGYEDLISDWSSRGGERDSLFQPAGAGKPVCEMARERRMKLASCRECVYDPQCLGFERTYYDVYGGREFKPLPQIPRALAARAKFEGAAAS